MNILSLGLDKTILDDNSVLARRAVEYAELVDSYTFLVPYNKNQQIKLSENLIVHGVSGKSKFHKLLNIKKQAEKIINNQSIDIITVQDVYFLGLLGVKLAKKYNLGLEIQIHGFEKYKCFRKLIARYVIKQADSIRAVSRRLTELLVRKFKVDPLKIIQVPIYIDVKSLQNREVSFNLHEKYNADFIFVSVQRLVSVKNVELQLRAMAILQKENIKLVVVGDGLERKNLEKLAAKLNITEQVEFVGWQNDLVNYYKGADALLISSKAEGWGMTAVEALACHLPVIMTNVGLAGEVVINNYNGLVVPVGDETKFVQTIKEFINNKLLKERLIKGANEEIKNILTKEETFEKYQQSWHKAKK